MQRDTRQRTDTITLFANAAEAEDGFNHVRGCGGFEHAKRKTRNPGMADRCPRGRDFNIDYVVITITPRFRQCRLELVLVCLALSRALAHEYDPDSIVKYAGQ